VEYEAHLLREAGKLCEEKWPRQVEEENMIAESLDEEGRSRFMSNQRAKTKTKAKGLRFPSELSNDILKARFGV